MLKVVSILLFDFMLRSINAIVVFHIKTSHLICGANQMTGFFMKYNAWLNCFKLFPCFFVNFSHSRYFFRGSAGGAIRSPSYISDEAFCENSERLKAVNYFC